MNAFYRKPIPGADENNWAVLNDALASDVIGTYTAYLINDSGDLKIKPGNIGIDDETNRGVSILDTETTIDISLTSVSTWGKVEMSVSGTSVTFSALDIVGANDPAVLPVLFTGAYNNDKSGFYINATSRVVGVYWKDSSGNLKGIVNCADKINGYVGENVTDDVNEDPIYFDKNLIQKDNKKFNNIQKFSIFTDITGFSPGADGQWFNLTFADTEINDIPGASLASNVFTLPKGKYKVSAQGNYSNTIAAGTGVIMLRVRDIDNNITKVLGVQRDVSFTQVDQGLINVEGVFNIDSETDIRLQVYTGTNITFLGGSTGIAERYGRKIIFERISE